MKKTNENLVILITLFAISIVIANVTGARTITTGLHIGPIELALSGGAITYAVTFLCTDIIGEIWGKATAQRVVKYGFIGQIFATACIMLTGVFPATDVVMDNAYQTLLGQNWIFVIGSLSAYLVSQSWDVAVFHAIRDRYIAKHGSTKGGRWLWNNGSTITSQIWDTVIYAVISFGFGLGWVHAADTAGRHGTGGRSHGEPSRPHRRIYADTQDHGCHRLRRNSGGSGQMRSCGQGRGQCQPLCRPFLYTVHAVVGSLQFQLTIKMR